VRESRSTAADEKEREKDGLFLLDIAHRKQFKQTTMADDS
jgi:hypothetical protein